MEGALIYFSGTGNTEFVIERFQENFDKYGVKTEKINVSKVNSLDKQYDFYVFGAPIHAEMYPYVFTDWIKKNVNNVSHKKCIIFSTQAADKASAPSVVNSILTNKGMKIVVQDFIPMPNNYYIVMFEKSSKEQIKAITDAAKNKVDELTKKFLKNDISIKECSKGRVILTSGIYKAFLAYSKKWAKKKLQIDYSKCIMCKKCEQDCPTNNIVIKDKKIEFKNECISCQKCIHKCPVNAFLYKGEVVEQYKI